MNSLTQRPAFGQRAAIGTFYDARRDCFLPRSLFTRELPLECISRINVQDKAVQVSYSDSYEDGFRIMGVGTELGASILAGLVEPEGSGKYLDEKRESRQVLHGAVHHRTTTVQEKLNTGSSEVRNFLAFSELQSSEVTHIVSEIKWGDQSIVEVRRRPLGTGEKSNDESQFRAQVEAFKSSVENSHPVNHENATELGGNDSELEIIVFSDVLTGEGVIMRDFQEAYEFLDLIPVHIKDENGGKGKPIAYTLLPISMLAVFLPIGIIGDVPSVPPSAECLTKFVQLLDEFSSFRQRLNDYQAYVMKHKIYMPGDYPRSVAHRVGRMRTEELTLKSKYAHALRGVRNGTSDPNTLWQLLREFAVGDSSPKVIAAMEDGHKEKVDFIEKIVPKGATYIGYNGVDLESQLSKRGVDDAYVFSFSTLARQDQQSWAANQALLLELLNEPRRKSLIVILDCDAISTILESAHISHFQKGKEVSSNLLEDRQFLADKSFARYSQEGLETHDIQKPLKRRMVKICCPGRNCDKNEICEWLCPQCMAPVEFVRKTFYSFLPLR
jgi:hypothetical protein